MDDFHNCEQCGRLNFQNELSKICKMCEFRQIPEPEIVPGYWIVYYYLYDNYTVVWVNDDLEIVEIGYDGKLPIRCNDYFYFIKLLDLDQIVRESL